MNVSWSDLGSVQDPGDYPFRDGTIGVTFAEIATWKERPDTQFQLMRKYHSSAGAHYTLGRQIDPGAVSPAMATILIAYDIHSPSGQMYDAMINAIQSLGGWWHHLETVLIVKCNLTPVQIRDQLRTQIGSDDQLLVIDISGDTVDWLGLNDPGSKWLTENVQI